MKKTFTWRRVVTVICLVSLTVSCGQKGDLYLPEGSTLISWIG